MTRILIADDNPQNLYLLESILKGRHFEVVSAHNGVEALDAARKNPPDLIITDILMPVMDGFALCRQWKADKQLKQIPFIFYTATYTDPKDERFAMSLGADRFMVKPQKPDVFINEISEVLEEVSQRAVTHPARPFGNDREILQEYNEVLFRKLEKKVLQLEAEITGHRQTEEDLLRSETRYRKLYESMMDAFIRVNMAGQIQEYNHSFREMLGYSDEELARLTYRDLTPEKWHASDQSIIETQILPQGYSSVYEKEHRKKDGTVFPIELRVSLIRDETGQPSGMWAIVRDITERKRAEEKIQLTNRKLTLMNDVTYQDIQNKVTGLRGYVELTKNYVHEPDQLQVIEKERLLLKSIHDLIKNTKEYQQMGVDQSCWIPLEPVIRMQLSRISQKHDVSLVSDLNGLEIYTDPLIERVFYNLIHNAINHGGKITRIFFGCRETPDGIVVFCEDDGIGIPFDQKSRIFDRYVAGEGKFGLFFVREFLTLSGMTIQETGTPGNGARFEITIPSGTYRF
ncbi:PAS domain S-box protein [Methanoregula sp.]|uniref:ATP-binding response regulator n=1 Tax=Methanoregula sp. TaxID=2052170 RepID=UPI0023752D08|nr:PAS domain S-box protein [Methanoregula sp.]MDD1685871.1 PAS domain S-box protein [Methanoregula sp.]